MRLFGYWRSSSTWRVRIALAHKRLAYTYRPVDLVAGDQHDPAYQQINPMAQVPVLELDDGTCVSESVAICRYFEEIQPEPSLFGVGVRERTLVEMWNRRVELELTNRVFLCFQNTSDFFKGRIPQVPDYGAIAKARAEESLALLDRVLAGQRFVAGDRYSIADITALVGIDFGRVVKLRPTPDQKNLLRWHAEVSARPSARA